MSTSLRGLILNDCRKAEVSRGVSRRRMNSMAKNTSSWSTGWTDWRSLRNIVHSKKGLTPYCVHPTASTRLCWTHISAALLGTLLSSAVDYSRSSFDNRKDRQRTVGWAGYKISVTRRTSDREFFIVLSHICWFGLCPWSPRKCSWRPRMY